MPRTVWASDALQLARAQFGLNIGFHIPFPSITIGLAWLRVYFRARWARTGEPAWLASCRRWTKVSPSPSPRGW